MEKKVSMINFSCKKKNYKDEGNEKFFFRKNCPPLKKMIKAARLEISLQERMDIVDHLDVCKFCSEEFSLINAALKIENEFLKNR